MESSIHSHRHLTLCERPTTCRRSTCTPPSCTSTCARACCPTTWPPPGSPQASPRGSLLAAPSCPKWSASRSRTWRRRDEVLRPRVPVRPWSCGAPPAVPAPQPSPPSPTACSPLTTAPRTPRRWPPFTDTRTSAPRPARPRATTPRSPHPLTCMASLAWRESRASQAGPSTTPCRAPRLRSQHGPCARSLKFPLHHNRTHCRHRTHF